MIKTALISKDGLFRYSLTRQWGEDPNNLLLIIGLNPSTADADNDDATMRRLNSFANREGYDGLVMMNLFCYRATDRDDMRVYYENLSEEEFWELGNDNLAMLKETDQFITRDVLFCWGSLSLFKRQKHYPWLVKYVECIKNLFPEAMCFGFNMGTQRYPKHPLYLLGDTKLIPYHKNIKK